MDQIYFCCERKTRATVCAFIIENSNFDEKERRHQQVLRRLLKFWTKYTKCRFGEKERRQQQVVLKI